MTLAAPKSRQGKSVLVLAFLAAVIAVLGVFIWSTTTHATFAATVTITDNAAGPNINQGEAIQYTIDVSGVGSTGATTGPNMLVVDFDDSLVGFFEVSTSGS